MENNIFTFNYQLVNATTSEMIHMGTVTLGLNIKELEKVAEAISDNGGFTVELPAIKWLDERVGELAIDDYQLNYADEDFDWDEVRIMMDEALPQELVGAATMKDDLMSVDCHFYYMKDGKEQMETVLLGVSPNVFQDMVGVVKLGSAIGADFDNLIEVNPDACSRSLECVLEYAFK